MSTPRDPHGDTDRGHRAAGGEGDATGPDPSAEADRADRYGATGADTAAVGNGDGAGAGTDDAASSTVPHTGRSGWDFTRGAEADPPTPAYGSPAVAPASGWSSAGQGEGPDRDPAGTAAWDPAATTQDTSWSPEADRAAAHGGWDPAGDRTAEHGGWDPAGAGIPGAASATSTLPGGEGRAARRRGRSGGGRTLIAGAALLAVVLAVLAVTAFWKPGFLVTEEFDQQALQAGVTRILTQDYGLGATGVSCPEGQKVEAGSTFSCTANVDGENVEVPVTVLDDQGTYQVARV
ncbi:DUF4333 domain-containing protein [Pseudonocardia kujensis]|uniref:DUF4333 domain-containing protein n=1 Tax=Pseudonocardia kujensis TaxID=1128675 RepID=UPI001E3F9A97|nr:DUF4333 domain-containing protein [Pseudonocardia kujensis]MCE0762211.1 DUF4333 domain-containing protein [Pseudonocardia kujensis]